MESRFELFCRAITRLNKFIQKIKAMEMTEFGLKGAHTMCIYYLGKFPDGLTVSELAIHCDEDKAAVSRSVSELKKLGFVLTESGMDKREYREKLVLSEIGVKTFDSIQEKIHHALDVGGAGLTDDERQIFYQSLKTISKNLEKYPEYK